MTFLWQALATFVAMTVLDVIYAMYVITAAAREALAASLWAAGMQLVNVFVVLSYVKDRRMAMPCALGAFVGTWLAIRWL